MATGFYWDEKCFWHGGGDYALTFPLGGVVQPLVQSAILIMGHRLSDRINRVGEEVAPHLTVRPVAILVPLRPLLGCDGPVGFFGVTTHIAIDQPVERHCR